MTDPPLTIVVPTRNRPRHCRPLLRFLREACCRYPIVVADSSDPSNAEAVRAACAGCAEYQHFPPGIRVRDKLKQVGETVPTRYVLPTPDDDIVLPSSIDTVLSHLDEAPDFVAAHGYVLNYGIHQNDFDVHRVSWFTPTIGQSSPLHRLYHLMRRYQPYYWSVMRRDAWLTSLNVLQSIESIVFGEIGISSILALQGRLMRLPLVFHLRGMETSQTSKDRSHPLYLFLKDSQLFFQSYVGYRETLRQFIRNRDIAAPRGADLAQLLDVIHATWLGPNIDLGVTYHAAQALLGEPIPPYAPRDESYRWREPETQDIVHYSADGSRRYIWRHAVLVAEPRDEICIDADEIARVERALDCYVVE